MMLSSGFARKNQGGAYSETLVTVPSGNAYLQAPAAAPAGTSSFLFFASIITDSGLTTRSCLASWDTSILDGIFATITTGQHGLYAAAVSANGVSASAGDVVAEGTRHDVLVSCWTSGAGGTLTLKGNYRPTGGSWTEAFVDQTTTAGNATIDDITVNAQRLFNRLGTNNDWYGQVARIAMWTATDNNEIADPGLTATQDNFALDSATSIVDPATARSAYGTPLYDFNGPASRYNAGEHDGSLGTFTVNGAFS